MGGENFQSPMHIQHASHDGLTHPSHSYDVMSHKYVGVHPVKIETIKTVVAIKIIGIAF